MVYVGTYTNGKSEGIYLYSLDASTGELTLVNTTKVTNNPSFLALDPQRKFLYAVNEVGEFAGKKGGGVSAFSINPKTGNLTLINQQSSLGGAPCFITVDKQGKNVLVANYSGGNVAVFPIAANGGLGEASHMEQHTG